MNIDNDELIRYVHKGIMRINGCWHRFGSTGYAEYLPNNERPDVWKTSGSISNQRLFKMDSEMRKNVESSKTISETDHELDAAKYWVQSETPKRDPVAIQLLDRCKKLQQERGEQYVKAGSQERSFARVATAFNAITGKDITSAEVCLMQQILKDVRQWSNPHRLHKDSVEDGVSYASLKGEELYHQFGEKTL